MLVKNTLVARRAAVVAAWNDHRGPVLIPAGQPLPIAGTDQFHDYHAHNEHRYLAGTAVPGAVLTFDAREGWTLFLPVASLDEQVWVGAGETIEAAQRTSGLDDVRPLAFLGGWLESHRGEALTLLGNHDIEANPEAYGLQHWRSLEPEIDVEASARLSEVISESRRSKDEWELGRMRAAVDATAAGHLAAMRLTRAGLTERQLQVEVEAEFFRNGGERTAYTSLIGGGANSSVLHFAPTARQFLAGEIALMDAAAEVEGYAADVTRVFPIGGRFEGFHRDLYQLVLDVQERAVASVRPGKEFRELHLEAAANVAQGLVDLGILRGRPSDLVERDAHAIFFPHGLGHMLGLSTHDAGGCLAGRTKSERFGLKWLRADLPLQENYVVTIEPGVYFIRALLTNPETRSRHAPDINWPLVDTLLDVGGVRIEDDVRVTDTGVEVLSAAIPKSIAAIESLREEAFA